ncbi:SprT family protein [Sporosarcina thermotolerans]|uniref:Protein SprT-like n=1 Tax=Sporosarcina thermotolerans TaxID=633404 RepID=A0AAW9AAJ3_9BACL|nr:SprT family protein [Sporosarcina thermotolerans]MDW0118074.1 SprT family protein [Sporosarcina thermotolerans]WHT49125.1 SprT family protein [Sporosarcina thermotolerans]
MKQQELQQLVQQLSIEFFGKPFRHISSFNPRLRTTGGRYKLQDGSIEINPTVLELYDADELIGIIKHELCHYHLHQEGKGYRHGDTDFKELLRKTDSPRYCKPLATENRKPRKIHLYRCKSCGLEYKRLRRMDVKKYRCGRCNGNIISIPY